MEAPRPRCRGGVKKNEHPELNKHEQRPNEQRTGIEVVPMTDAERVTGTHFSFFCVQKVLRFVLAAATSLRGAAGVMEILLQDESDPSASGLSHNTVRNLVQRIGLYEISRARPLADDWIWIIDHTIQAGTMKCFVVMGIRQTDFLKLKRPLEHHDMEMLDLIPVETSNGKVVHEQLTALTRRLGVPIAILSDRGSDLKKGVELLQEDYPDVVGVYDIVHKVSRLIGRILKDDEQWAKFRKSCCSCAHAVRQSGMAHLKPPTPKTKARDMNIDREISWGTSTRNLLEKVRSGDVTAEQKADLPQPVMEEKFGWLDEFAVDLARWQELNDICEQTCSIVRRFGYDRHLSERLRALPEGNSDDARTLVKQIQDFGAETAAAMGSLDCVPGSSEVIESVIGKGKQLAQASGSRGMTSQILAMAATVAETTREYITDALKKTGIKQLKAWSQKFLPTSLESKRQRDLKPIKAEQNLRKPRPATTPNF